MDCNDCEHLNIKESEQINNMSPHICLKYNKRVLHMSQSLIHDDYIYPCKECKSNYLVTDIQ
jgi:hypothetical protein